MTTPIKMTQTVCENMLRQMLYSSGNKVMISSVNATICIQREQYSKKQNGLRNAILSKAHGRQVAF